MNIYDATEQAYKNGYAAGFEAGRQSVLMQLTSTSIDTEDEVVGNHFKLEDGEWHTSFPFSREEDCMLLDEVSKKE